MLNVVECAQNNQILSEIFSLILSLHETKPETVKQHPPSKLIDLLTYLSNSCNTKSAIANPLEIIFLACQELCQVDTLELLEIPELLILLQSELIQILNKFNKFDLLDIETFSVIINEPEVKNIEQILTILGQNGFQINKELIFEIAKTLRKSPEEDETEEALTTPTSQLGLFHHPDVKPMEEEPDAKELSDEKALFTKR